MSNAILCDCEKGHNGCGLMVRECDCGENAIADTYWRKATLIISAMPPRTPTQFELQEVIARALMAAAKEADEAATTRERERCAEIALLHTKADVGDAAATAVEGLRLGAASIYNAILKGEA